ncbi:MAG: hypothetical protein K9G48_15370 [Reyranella sp.]|nr:hypothetical protein [Reyranella sp.]
MTRPPRKPASEPATEPPQRGPSELVLKNFLRFLGLSGSVTFAASKAGIERRTLYRRKAADEAFAAEWDEALQLGIDRLQDSAMQRALHGTERQLYRNGRQVGSTQQYDNKLLQFLLRAHRPEVYGARQQPAAPPLPFDLAQRLAASAPRADAYDEAKRAGNLATEKPNDESKKQGG